MAQENFNKLTFMQEIMVYVLMGGLGIIVLVLMLSFVYPYFRPHKKGTMPSNLGLIQQRCVKKIMEHVDAKTSHNDVDDQGRNSKIRVAATVMLVTLGCCQHCTKSVTNISKLSSTVAPCFNSS